MLIHDRKHRGKSVKRNSGIVIWTPFPSFNTKMVSVKAKKVICTRRPFNLAPLYFRGHGRSNATSVHTGAVKECRDESNL